MRIFIPFFVLILIVLISGYLITPEMSPAAVMGDSVKLNKTEKGNGDCMILQAKLWTKQKAFDTSFAVLINYKKHSGFKRAYLADLASGNLFDSFLVSHGCGNHPWGNDKSKFNPGFSNSEGSHLSSLGRFKIGKRGTSQWGVGIKYILHGLDSSNSNAAKRTIVLHSWEAVPDSEIYPNGCPEGWGCPAVSNAGMLKLDSVIRSKKLPVLLWAY